MEIACGEFTRWPHLTHTDDSCVKRLSLLELSAFADDPGSTALLLGPNVLNGAAFSPDGKRIVSGYADSV
jgi:hypothetical protein